MVVTKEYLTLKIQIQKIAFLNVSQSQSLLCMHRHYISGRRRRLFGGLGRERGKDKSKERLGSSERIPNGGQMQMQWGILTLTLTVILTI